MRFKRGANIDERLRKLARRIEAMAGKDEDARRQSGRIAGLRSRAALELHTICAAFVDSVNRLLPKAMLELSPPEYSVTSFRDPGSNVFQVGASGRVIHIEFRATDTMTSTERFHVPYIIEGAVRSFNQELLDLAVVPEQLLVCCLEGERLTWLWIDPRTQHTGPLDQQRLTALFERLV